MRNRIIRWTEHRLAGSPESEALLKALILGRTDSDTSGKFRDCGLSFLLALSGMHITLIIELLNLLLLFLLPKNIRNPVTGLLLLFFLWITGIRHSLIRAFLMFLFRSLQEYRGRPVEPMTLILATAAVHLLIFPEAVLTLSFQLSYLAVLGILYFTPLIRLMMPRFLPVFLAEALSLSLGAQAAVNPLLLVVFGEIHPMSLLSVLFFTPVITLILWAGLLYLLLAGFGPAARLLELALRLLAAAVELLYRFFSGFPPLRAGKGGDKTLIWISLIPPLLLSVYYLYRGVSGLGKKAEPELRFPHGDQNPSGDDGTGAPETLGPEFSDQSGGPEAYCRSAED